MNSILERICWALGFIVFFILLLVSEGMSGIKYKDDKGFIIEWVEEENAK